MSRGPLVDTADVWRGSASPFGPPLTPYRFAVACRFVDQNQIFNTSQFLSQAIAWITMDLPEIDQAQQLHPAGGVLTIDYNTGDFFEVPAGSGQFFGVLWGERVYTAPLTSYVRYHVCAYPFDF